MTGTLRKKGHPASEALGTAEVESVGTVKVGRAGGTVRIGGSQALGGAGVNVVKARTYRLCSLAKPCPCP